MKEIYSEMKKSVDGVIESLAAVNHPRTADLQRVAQYFDGMAQGGYMPQVNPMSSGDEGSSESLNPNVSSFVKMRPNEEPMVDDRKTHTCAVTFKAPEGVSEADMMNYILGIGKELGVDVDSFKWSKAEAKQVKPAV